MKMSLMGIIVAALLGAPSSFAAVESNSSSDPELSAACRRDNTLEVVRAELNSMCRGWSGDAPLTRKLCSTRDQLERALDDTYGDLNEICRGSPGELPQIRKVCSLRDRLGDVVRP